MKNAVISCLLLCTACVIDREIGGLDPGRLGGPSPQATTPPPLLPPPLRSNEPCCALGARLAVDLGEEKHQALSASAAWDGARWAVTWGDFTYGQNSLVDDLPAWHQTAVRFIEDGAAGASFRVRQLGSEPSGIAHHPSPREGDRYLIAFNRLWVSPLDREVDHTTRIVAVNASGVEQAAGVVQHASRGVSLAHSPALRALAVGALDRGRDSYASGGVILLDQETLQPIREGIPLGQALGWYGKTVTALALEDKVVTVVLAADGVHVRTFVGRGLDEPHPEVVIPVGNQVDPRLSSLPVDAMAAAVVRDRVLVAALNRETLRTWTYRPAMGAVTAGPLIVDVTSNGHSLAMAGESVGGTAGICYGVEARYAGQPGGLRFVGVGPDGEPRGKPVELVPIGEMMLSCGVAAGKQDEYLVTLDSNIDPQTGHSLFAQTVRVQRATAPIE
jgi:hypothetical protein